MPDCPIGSTRPIQVDLEKLIERFNHPAVKADLARFDLTRVPLLLSMQVISDQNGGFVPPDGTRVHSDFFPTLEYVAQRAFFLRRGAQQYQVFDEKYSARPTLLLGEYLRKHPLTEDDYQALAVYHTTHKLISSRLMRTILDRWLQEHPQSTVPVELFVQLADPGDPAELETKRLQPFRDLMFQRADAKDPELLRVYAKYLMQTHREHRSAFHVPNTQEIQAVMEKLIETDPANQRVYKLYLAEIAWDRGDDATCLRLGQSAFDPDPAKGGPVSFKLAPRAPHFVLIRMIETFWRAGRLREAWALCQEAAQNGYVGEKATERDHVLEMTYRKIQALAGQPLSAQAN
jgi:hypothetical protein